MWWWFVSSREDIDDNVLLDKGVGNSMKRDQEIGDRESFNNNIKSDSSFGSISGSRLLLRKPNSMNSL